MRRFAALFLALVTVGPADAAAWGFEAHKFIVERAVDLLPEGMRPFYQRHRAFIVEHSIDPDLWRSVGFEEETPHHFLDLDFFGKFPFAGLPREYGRAIEQFGRPTLERNGTLPWRTAEMVGHLRRAFELIGRGNAPYALNDVQLFSAVIGHYVADGHVPLHAVVNYDGQLSGQRGIHARFEAELFTRYRTKLTIAPPPLSMVPDATDFMFSTLLESFQLADSIFKADREALGAGDVYDDGYFERFLRATQATLERRLSASVSAVASVVAAAWEKAGRPELPLQPAHVIRKVEGREK